MSKCHRNYDEKGYRYYDEVEPYTDGCGNTAYSGTGYSDESDHVYRPVLLDAEGKKHPIISYFSGYNAEDYVMKAKRVGEHINNAPPFRQPVDLARTRGSAPFSSNGRAPHYSTGKYGIGDTNLFGDEARGRQMMAWEPHVDSNEVQKKYNRVKVP